MKIIERQIEKLDLLQRKSTFFGFVLAVIKKYGDERSGQNAALITYYGFLSLFPLLIIVTSLLQLTVGSEPSLHAKLLASVSNYFPVLGRDLSSNIHSFRRSGAGLVIGLLIALYGARGIADILRFSFDQVWHVPLGKRLGFPKNLINSLEILFVGGFGMLFATGFSVYASGLGRGGAARLFTTLLSFLIILLTLYGVFRIGITDKKIPVRTILSSALTATICLQILQSLGAYLMAHELRTLSTLYGTFAVVLGLFFWIYLQAQVLLYSMQATAVSHLKLWPRAINQTSPTEADKNVAARSG